MIKNLLLTVATAVAILSQPALAEPNTKADIVDVAVKADSFKTLVAAVKAAGLVDVLKGDGPFTVFAPTDEAFKKLPEGTVESLLKPENKDKLVSILKYHVIPAKVMAKDVKSGKVKTVLGKEVNIKASEWGVKVDNAKVIKTDVAASNGVIHVIDAVLTPPADEVPGPFDGVDCAVTISATGTAFTVPSVTIDVGQTVCWSWEDAAMPHNVRQVDGPASSTYVENGVYSGAAASTVAFHHTFTEDVSFYYACEPHIGLNMFGEIIVGEGSPAPAAEESTSEDAEDTPGFLMTAGLVALLGAAMVAGRRNRTA